MTKPLIPGILHRFIRACLGIGARSFAIWSGGSACKVARPLCISAEASDGTRIVTDPYKPDRGIPYGPITEPAEFVTVSHDHFDHNDVAGVPGKPKAIRSVRQPQRQAA